MNACVSCCLPAACIVHSHCCHTIILSLKQEDPNMLIINEIL